MILFKNSLKKEINKLVLLNNSLEKLINKFQRIKSKRFIKNYSLILSILKL